MAPWMDYNPTNQALNLALYPHIVIRLSRHTLVHTHLCEFLHVRRYCVPNLRVVQAWEEHDERIALADA